MPTDPTGSFPIAAGRSGICCGTVVSPVTSTASGSLRSVHESGKVNQRVAWSDRNPVLLLEVIRVFRVKVMPRRSPSLEIRW